MCERKIIIQPQDVEDAVLKKIMTISKAIATLTTRNPSQASKSASASSAIRTLILLWNTLLVTVAANDHMLPRMPAPVMSTRMVSCIRDTAGSNVAKLV